MPSLTPPEIELNLVLYHADWQTIENQSRMTALANQPKDHGEFSRLCHDEDNKQS